MKKTAAFIVSICWLLASCGVPLFNEDVAATILRTSEMALAATVGPMWNEEENEDPPDRDEMEEFIFYPERDNYSKGFLVLDWERTYILYWNGDYQFYGVDGGESFLNYENWDDRRLSFRAEPLGTASIMAHINVSPIDDPPFPTWRYEILAYSDKVKRLIDAASYDIIGACVAVPGSPAGLYLASASIRPTGSRDSQWVYFFCEDSANPGEYHEYKFKMTPYGLEKGKHIRGPGWRRLDVSTFGDGFPFEPRPFYYYYPKEELAILCIYDPDKDKYRTITWDDELLPSLKELDIPHRIDALLSSGHLLCQTDTDIHIYDLKGNKVNEFERKDLRFVFESIDGEMVFTYPFFVESEKEEEMGLYIRVYTLPTRMILSLGNEN